MINFIENVAEFYPLNYFNEDFHKEVIQKSGYSGDDIKAFNKKVNALKEKYYAFKGELIESKLRVKDKVTRSHRFHTLLLQVLGYTDHRVADTDFVYLNEKEAIPVRHRLYRADEQPHLYIMEMQAMIAPVDEPTDGLFEQRYDIDEERTSPSQKYHRSQWANVFTVPEGVSISPMIINKAVGEIFLLDAAQRPKYILLLAGNKVFLLEQEKWFKGQYLIFDLESLFVDSTVQKNYLSLFYLMLSKETLAPLSDIILMDQLEEESHKKAYEVTKDLKEAVVHAVESIANEAVYYMGDDAQGLDADQLKNECLTYVYRLLFVFYAESREDLDILPSDDRVYQMGYSMEMLRDLEQVALNTAGSQEGYFFHESISGLFKLLHTGYRERQREKDNTSFSIRRIDSPMFDDSKMPYLSKIKIRNQVWQDIICQLSLSQKQKNKKRGRISYANLGINQLGSVYESLLAYRGVFAEESQIEVHRKRKKNESSAKAAQDGSYLVNRSRYEEFDPMEVYYEGRGELEEELRIIPKGTFVYRLSGRDRQKSASYYTPEVLTKCTVKYTLKPILERLDKGAMKAIDLLDLKILEPAMGAAAFHNEAINQLAEAYLTYRQQEITTKSKEGQRVSPDQYQTELQKVKAYIALNNVYGVDLNPTAVELGKLSLWLNVIHKDMETPFFGYRLGTGNAVVGTWLKGYKVKDIQRELINKKSIKKTWWELAPTAIPLGNGPIRRPGRDRQELIYHFLLPDKNMVPSASIKLLKKEYPAESKKVSEWKSDFIKPIEGEEIQILRSISKEIDQLLEDHYLFQKKVSIETAVKPDIYGLEGQVLLSLKSFDEKEEMAHNREHTESPFFKLKMVMDYWCGLWYWDVRQAMHLPTRREWYQDIMNILQMDASKIAETAAAESTESGDVVSNHTTTTSSPTQADDATKERQLSIGYRSDTDQVNAWGDALVSYGDSRSSSLFAGQRLRLVRDMAQQYRYFHYQLEFIEVFRERGGFDIAVGNPPWLKLQFEEKGLMSEVFPELEIRKVSAPGVRKLQTDFLSIPAQAASYYADNIEIEAAATFMNAYQNYPLLKGQQTNLYKCVLENGFKWINEAGYLGLLHPEGVYDDPKGQPLRKEMYQRLKFHFQFQNAFNLFAEVAHREKYGSHIYSGKRGRIMFKNINNLFHPSTIEGCMIPNSQGLCGGIKIKDEVSESFIWNVKVHSSRCITYTEKELKILAITFENSSEWESAKLVSIHAREILEILNKLKFTETSIKDYENKVTVGWDETNDRNSGNIVRTTKFPNIDNYEMIYSGPHFFTSNPLYKTPRSICIEKADYDVIDLSKINENYFSRTNFIPSIPINLYTKKITGLDGSDYFDYHKIIWRRRISLSGERSLLASISLKKSVHINTVNSMLFRSERILAVVCAFSSSLLYDFLVKSVGKGDFRGNDLRDFPIVDEEKFNTKLIVRVLALNSISRQYESIWETNWKNEYLQDKWSTSDPRLKPFSSLTREWTWDTPLRNYYERRWALVEIDVITAMALSLTLEELILIYNVQFPVLQQNEDDTWYDTQGQIVFTCSKGLTGVGLDRSEWNHIKALQVDETVDCQSFKNMRCEQPGEIIYTITKSELYMGEERTYRAPFDKCDRVEDYKVAWSHFERVFREG